jgi:FkbM family methyltransferase
MVVIDIGANIGFYTLLAASLLADGGRVHSFEPTSAVFRRLNENILLNGLQNRVFPNQAAICDSSGSTTLYIHEDDSEGNSLALSETHPSSETVAATTIDQYVSNSNIKTVHLLKMDIEGAEYRALIGGAGLFHRPDAPLLIVELNPEALSLCGKETSEVITLLNAFGYDCFQLEKLTSGSDPVLNVLAAKSCHKGDLARLAMPLLKIGGY